MDTDEVRHFYLLLCFDCTPPLPMPFLSLEERGKWAAQHTEGAGHDDYRVWEEPYRAPRDA